MINNIRNYIEEIKSTLDSSTIIDLGIKPFEFNTSELPDSKESFDVIQQNSVYKEIHELLLNEKETPFIYWFEFDNKEQRGKILEALKEYEANIKEERHRNTPKKDLKYFATPAVKLKTEESNILYVGKVNRDLIGRLQPHFGFYTKSPNTSGLQLRYWANGLNLILKLYYIALPKELVDFTGLLERKLAKDLKPIIGKHRS